MKRKCAFCHWKQFTQEIFPKTGWIHDALMFPLQTLNLVQEQVEAGLYSRFSVIPEGEARF